MANSLSSLLGQPNLYDPLNDYSALDRHRIEYERTRALFGLQQTCESKSMKQSDEKPIQKPAEPEFNPVLLLGDDDEA